MNIYLVATQSSQLARCMHLPSLLDVDLFFSSALWTLQKRSAPIVSRFLLLNYLYICCSLFQDSHGFFRLLDREGRNLWLTMETIHIVTSLRPPTITLASFFNTK